MERIYQVDYEVTADGVTGWEALEVVASGPDEAYWLADEEIAAAHAAADELDYRIEDVREGGRYGRAGYWDE